jgi:flagellar basal body P-ring formation protein FlgA
MMTVRSLLLATALLAASAVPSLAQSREDVAVPVLRASVNVSGDVVRIGDVVDNAGNAAQIAIYRAPDLGTTGSLPTAQVLAALRAHQVIGWRARWTAKTLNCRSPAHWSAATGLAMPPICR